MKKFLNSIYFYPFVAVVSIFIGLFGFYFYAVNEAQEVIIKQQLQDKTEGALLFKNISEELSMGKKKSALQRETTRFALYKNTRYVLLLDRNGTVLYASRFHYMGKNLKDIFDAKLAAHYMQELHDNVQTHIHPYKKDKIHITLTSNYLYNYITDTIEPGYIIIQYDISPLITKQTRHIQQELFYIFIAIASLVLLLFYFYYRYFFTKLHEINHLTNSLAGKKQESTTLISIDTVIEHLLQTTTEFAIMSRVVQYSSDAIVITDKDKKIIVVNPAFEALTGYKLSEIIGKRPEGLVKSELMDKEYYQRMWHDIKNKGIFQGQITDRRKDGTSYTVWQKIWSLKDPNTGEITNYAAMSKNISELIEKEKQIENLAYYDGLTDLVNRSYFFHMVDKTIKRRSKEPFTLLYLNLDNLKEINETFGYAAGDTVITKFASFLKENLRDEDIISRLGGDEFAVMAANMLEPEVALELCHKIIEFSNITLPIHEKPIQIGVSVGAAFYPLDGSDHTSLLAAADIAMRRSKMNGKNRCTMFEEEMQKEAVEKINIRLELKNAITNNELVLYYQPKFSLNGKNIVGFEALIRWIHPTKGFMRPDLFIPIAEESGLIVDMTNWIFQEVNKTLLDFKAIYKENFSIAVNISAKHFKKESLIKEIKKYIDEELIVNGYLELEVTESALMKDVTIAQKQLQILNRMGISIALDDYGTGYSSLAYLKNLPVGTLKVDKSFVDGLCTNEKDYAIVKSTIELAKSLKMKTTVEGVEDQNQLDKLQSMHADYIQGYVFSRPLKKEDAVELLKASS